MPRPPQAMPGVVVVHDGDVRGRGRGERVARGPGPAPPCEPAVEGTRPSPRARSSSPSCASPPAPPARRRAPTSSARSPEAMSAAAQRLETTYTVAYIAHVPLEPRAAVAEWSDGRLTVWTGTQRPFGVRSDLAEAFHLPEDKVRVIVPDTGSGYGGKHTGGVRHRGGPAGQGGRPAGEGRLDPRGGVPLGLLPPGRRHRREERRRGRRASSWPGRCTTTTPAPRGSARPTTCRISASSSIPPTRRCARARIAAWRPRPTTSPASRTWTSWPRRWEWTRSSSAAATSKDPRLRAVLEAAAERFGWADAQSRAGSRPRHRLRDREGQLRGHRAEVRVDGRRGSVRVVRLVDRLRMRRDRQPGRAAQPGRGLAA